MDRPACVSIQDQFGFDKVPRVSIHLLGLRVSVMSSLILKTRKFLKQFSSSLFSNWSLIILISTWFCRCHKIFEVRMA